MREVVIHLLPHQRRFIESEKPVSVLCGGRGCGKTEAAGLAGAISLLKGERIVMTAQSYKVLRYNLFERLIQKLTVDFGVKPKVNYTDMVVRLGEGAAFFWSADTKDPNGMRGLDRINKLFMDEAALATREFYQIAIATMRGEGLKNPQAFLMTTPRGVGNWVSQMRGKESAEWIGASMRDNTKLDESYYRMMESQYFGKFARQELLGEVLDGEDVDSVFETIDLMAAKNRDDAKAFGRAVLGVDVARFGDDRTTFWKRIGKVANRAGSLEKSDTFAIMDGVRKAADRESCTVNFDGSGNQAGGPIDMLRREKWDVNEIMFNASSPDSHFKNMRTYMYMNLREAIRRGLKIPDDDRLLEELQAVRYTMAEQGVMQLVPKEQTKKALGRSPDDADGLALTFAKVGRDIWDVPEWNPEAGNERLREIFNSYR